MPVNQGSPYSQHVKRIVDAFILWSKNNLKIEHQTDFIDHFKNKRKGKLIDDSNLRRLFPWTNKHNYHWHIENDKHQIHKLIEYIKDFTHEEGFDLIWRKNEEFEIPFYEPELDEKGAFIIEGQKKNLEAPIWHLYFYSDMKQRASDENKLNDDSSIYNFETGEIYINVEFFEKSSGPAKIVLYTKPKTITLYSEWYVEHNTVHYRAVEMPQKQKNYNPKITRKTKKFPINFYFKKFDGSNFNVGVYSSMLNQSDEKKSTPICGLVIAIKEAKGFNQNDVELKALIHYLLRHKELKEAHSGFTFPIKDISKIPEQAKIWYQDVREAKGTYAVYFYDPYFQKFNKGYMNIAIDGTAILYIRSNADNNGRPFIGVLKKINRESRQNNLIISLSYFPQENEYRVRCLLTTKNSGGKYFLFGTYSALQFEQLKPFSSLFAAVKLKKSISLQAIKKRIQSDKDKELGKFEHFITNNRHLKVLMSKINSAEIRKFFTPGKEFNINSIALKLHPEI